VPKSGDSEDGSVRLTPRFEAYSGIDWAVVAPFHNKTQHNSIILLQFIAICTALSISGRMVHQAIYSSCVRKTGGLIGWATNCAGGINLNERSYKARFPI
jgi:hypothetical protein